MLFKLLSQFIIWIAVLIMPMGLLPTSTPDYKCIANPTAEIIASSESNAKGGQFHPDTKSAAGVFTHLIVNNIKGKDVDKSVLRNAMEVMPIKDRENTENRKGGGTMPENAGGFFQMLFKGNRDLFMYLVPTDKENVYEIAGDYAKYNGEQMRAVSGIYYDAVTSQIYTKNQKGIYGTSFNFQMDDFLVTTENNAFQRALGFTAVYDWLTPLAGYDIDTIRIRFPFDGRDWMVQAWKGNYTGIANGAEIGIYEKPQSRLIKFYDCSTTELPMVMKLYTGGEKMFEQDMGRTWWLGVFQPSSKMKPKNITMEGFITFDESEMQAAFVKAVAKLGLEYSEKGATVRFVW